MAYHLIIEGRDRDDPDSQWVIWDPVPCEDEEWVAWNYQYWPILRIEPCTDENALAAGAEATVVVEDCPCTCINTGPVVTREDLEEMGIDPDAPPPERPQLSEIERARLRQETAAAITAAEDEKFLSILDRINK